MAFPRALLPPLLTSASTVSLGECGWLARGPVSGSRLAHLLSEALRCFTCEQPTALPLCETITNCNPEDTACRTSQPMFRFNHSPGVTSSCSSSCEAADPDSIGAAHPSYCCSHDLCNSMGVARLSAGALAPRGP
ncbi:secreted Ly-6/uPAR-related protein 1 [Lagenorhynchus albirostris]|uniref:secreted Ly-6/uPAR-related protein 1 n=1 Tax=Lagenorhynchus albirostris TaxID=27610 RepID=UPI0028EAE039|nr:secreted Ly-6/uPAR-related protein 1 [Lagenorhynchus albirostris]